MQLVTGPGLVLRRTRHLEHDMRLTILLRDTGKILAVSKGGQRLKSRLKAIQEPFTEADFHLYAPEHGINARLAGGKLVNTHHGIRENYEAFQTATRCCEAVEVLLPYRAPSPDVFDILRDALRSLNSVKEPQIDWIVFVMRLLYSLGHSDILSSVATLLETSPSPDVLGLDLSQIRGIVPAERIDRCLAFIDAELERVLPWKLKSDGSRTDEEPTSTGHEV